MMRKNVFACHSEPVQEIMGVIPSWITRWGVTIILSILLVILIGCCIIRYPETVSGTIELISSEHDGCYGTMLIPSNGVGKIKTGQTVNVRLSGFPYMEFGITKGVVSDDIPVPEKGQDGSVNYRVGIKLPSELVTTYEKRLPFIPRMNGDAEVIVEDRRLIETILGPVKSIMKNR